MMDKMLRGEVRSILKAHEAAWNRGDADALFDHALPAIHWVSAAGVHWRGLDEVRFAHRVQFERMAVRVPLSLEAIESIVQPLPQTLIAVARWRMGQLDAANGQTTAVTDNRMSLVFVGAPESLRIAHVANIVIDAEAAGSDPVPAQRG